MKKITSFPMLLGALIGLFILGAIIVGEIWFPWIGEYHDKHKRLVQAVLFTTVYFVVYVYGLRRWRHQATFWPTVLALFLLHAMGVFFYSTHVQTILVWQWPIVGLLEYYSAAFFLEWSRRRFGRFDNHGHPRLDGGHDA